MQTSNPTVNRVDRSFRRALILALGLAALSLVAVFAFAPKRSLERLGVVPEFRFEKVPQGFLSRGDLLGKVWVGGFVFTSCKGICPMLCTKMQALESDFGEGKDFRQVAFSIDPVRDTPAALNAYSKVWSKRPESWFFTRPTREQLIDFATGLKLVVGEVGDFAHTSRLVLVDKNGWVRGYYHGTDDDQFAQLRKDIYLLLDE